MEACSQNDLAVGTSSWVLWGVPLGGIFLGALAGGTALPVLWTLGFLVMGIACLVNAARCGRHHCFITGPLFLGAALVSALRGVGVLSLSWTWVGAAVLVGVVLAYAPERLRGRYVTAERTEAPRSATSHAVGSARAHRSSCGFCSEHLAERGDARTRRAQPFRRATTRFR